MNKKIIDLTGKTFGSWFVEELSHSKKKCGSTSTRLFWRCKCLKCSSNDHLISGYDLRSGKSTQCRSCQIRERSITHGCSRKKIYFVWKTMKERCSKPNSPKAKHYYERGIRVCDEWKNFSTFNLWAQSNGYQEGMQIHREDNDGNYCSENCKFLTASEHIALHNKERAMKKKKD